MGSAAQRPEAKEAPVDDRRFSRTT